MKLWANENGETIITSDTDETIQYMLDSKKVNGIEVDVGKSEDNTPLYMTIKVPLSHIVIRCKTTEGRIVKIFNVCPQCGKISGSCEHDQASPAQSYTVAVRDEDGKAFGYICYVKITTGQEGIPIAEIHQYVLEDGKPVVGEDGTIKTRRL